MRISDWSSDVCSSDLGNSLPERVSPPDCAGPRAALQYIHRRRPWRNACSPPFCMPVWVAAAGETSPPGIHHAHPRLAPGERPPAKLLKRGATVLSDAELLAIFLGSGPPGLAAVATADRKDGVEGTGVSGD